MLPPIVVNDTFGAGNQTLRTMRTALYLLLLLLPATMLAQQNDPQLTAKMNGQMAKRPTAVFEENKGQMKDQHWQPRPDVLFNGSAQGMHYYIRDNGMSYQLSRVESWKDEEDDRFDMPGREKRQVPDEMGTYRVDVAWTDFNPDFTVEKGEALDGYNNYYNVPEGVEPALFVKQYESVTLKELWPGIDLRCYSTDGHLETDWLVAPGADYTQIRFEVKGAELRTDGEGHLIMGTPFGEIREGTLKVFQGGRQLEAYWRLASLTDSSGTVSFEVMGHDPMLAMRIDPVVRVWGTYYGGSENDYGYSCAMDGSGNVYLAGRTNSNSSIALGGHQNVLMGESDAFLVKFSSNGVRQWATYYGGNGGEVGYSCATDSSGNVYLAGQTNSTNAIASNGHQNTLGGFGDAMLVKFNSSGVRQWATYYGGGGNDYGRCCFADSNGDVYLTGHGHSTSAIASDGHQNVHGGSADAFLVKFNGNGVRLWATYYGGMGSEFGLHCSTDSNGNVYIAGYTESANAIASSGHQNSHGGGIYDAFLVKFNGNGVRQWATYYGGNGADIGSSCSSDGAGNVYLAGHTESNSAIAFDGHQNTYGGGTDAFIVKFDISGVRQWATYYGGTDLDRGHTCAVDGNDNVYLAGMAVSVDGIASLGHQNTSGGYADAFLTKFNDSGVRQWATYYGGGGSDEGHSCTIDGSGVVYLTGMTTGSTTAIASDGHQDTNGGGADAFLVKFNDMVQTGLSEDNPTALSFTVFPNPGNGLFTLVTSEGGAVRLTVTDISGREVLQESYTATPGTARSIDISKQANGIYTLRIETEKGNGGVRLVKE